MKEDLHFFMTEGIHGSHTAAKDCNTKTMGDGGNDAWNMWSSFLDIQFSFYRAIDLCSSKSATLESYWKMYGETKTYLEISRGPIPEPELDYLIPEDMLEICTLSFLEHMVTWKKLMRVVKRR